MSAPARFMKGTVSARSVASPGTMRTARMEFLSGWICERGYLAVSISGVANRHTVGENNYAKPIRTRRTEHHRRRPGQRLLREALPVGAGRHADGRQDLHHHKDRR